jgi:hypothetical protein
MDEMPFAHLFGDNGRVAVVPDVDDRFSDVMVVVDHAHRGRREQQTTALDGRKPDPAHGKNAKNSPVRKDEHVAVLCAERSPTPRILDVDCTRSTSLR